MPSRYRILPFGASELADPRKLLTTIQGGSATNAGTATYRHWCEVVAHLGKVGTKALLVQEAVRDPDFLEEYEVFYSEQHRKISRLCKRVHGFRTDAPIGAIDDKAVLKFIDVASGQPGSYVGFVTLRPLRHAPVGATILAEDPSLPVLCKDTFPVHIAGTSFLVTGTPYLQQDSAVGACAQAGMWMALRTLRRRVGNTTYSPAQLTISATKYWALNRVFPGRHGLTAEQMLSAITASNHDPHVIRTSTFTPVKIFEEALPYLRSGLPVILALMHPNHGGHVVVAIGVDPKALAPSAAQSLLIHNDNQGPYRALPATVPPGSNDYAIEQTQLMIVPLPHGVFMSAAEAHLQAGKHLGYWLKSFLQAPPVAGTPSPVIPLVQRTYLCTRHAFRKWALRCAPLDAQAREIYRTIEMPKLVWVTELHDLKLFDAANPSVASRVAEVVLDAAADAGHGDNLMLLRVSKSMLTAPAQAEGLLVFGDDSTIKLASALPCDSLTEPWSDE